MDLHGAALDQRRANGVGAAMLFVPRRTARQGHARSLVGKVFVAQGVHQHAPGVGQHHHALAVAHLIKHVFHDGARMRQQHMVGAQGVAQAAAADGVRCPYARIRGEPRSHAARPRTREPLVDQATGALAKFKQVLPGLSQGQGGGIRLHERSPSPRAMLPGLCPSMGVAASARKRWTQQNGPSDPFRDSCRRMERCGWRGSSISLPHEMKELYKSIAYAIHGPGTVCECFLSSGCPSGAAGSTFHLETNP